MPKLDLVFAISSTSTDAEDVFLLMISTIDSLLQKYDSSNVRHGLLVYGDNATVVVDLKNNTVASEVKEQLLTVAPSPGRSDVSKALEAAATVFSEANDRPDADRALVIMTDNNSPLDEDVVIDATKPLEQMAVKIISVAVGDEVNPTDFVVVTAKENIIRTDEDKDPDDLGVEIMERVISK